MNDNDQAHVGIELSKKIGPLLTGHHPLVQGVALADLLATLLAGHLIPGDVVKTAKLREDLLERHVAAVRNLIPVNEMMLEETQAKKEMVSEVTKQ